MSIIHKGSLLLALSKVLGIEIEFKINALVEPIKIVDTNQVAAEDDEDLYLPHEGILSL